MAFTFLPRRRCSVALFLPFGWLILFLLPLRAGAAIDTLYVSVSGSDMQGNGTAQKPWRSVTFALQTVQASAAFPKALKLSSGTFSAAATNETFPLHLKNYVAIIGSGAFATIIDAGQTARVFTGNNVQQVSVMDLCLQNGKAPGVAQASGQGAGLWVKGFTDLQLIRCRVRNNQAEDLGGGLFVSRGSGFTLQDCWLENNTAFNGGALYHDSSTATIIAGVTMQYNKAMNIGGGMFIASTAPIIQKCRIRWNTAEQSQQTGAGGIVLQNVTGAVIGGAFDLGNDIHENVGAQDGSQLLLFGRQSTADARYNFWGALPSRRVASPTDQINSSNARNVSITATFGARDFYVAPGGSDEDSGTPQKPWRTIRYALSQIFATELDTLRLHLRSGVYSHAATGENFPIQLKTRINLLGAGREATSIDGADWHESELINSANIAAVRMAGLTLRNANKGALLLRACERVQLDSLQFENNKGSHGAGLRLINCENMSLTASIFRGNQSTGAGGALALYGDDNEISRNMFIDNLAQSGGAVACDSNSTTVFTQNDFTGNRAEIGGAMYIAQSRIELSSNRMRNNHATLGGGAIALDGASLPLIGANRNRGNDIYDNTTEGQSSQLYRVTPGLTVDARYNYWGEIPHAGTAHPFTEFSLVDYRNIAIRLPRGARTLFVAPHGNDEATGASPAEPLRTIAGALKLFFGTPQLPMQLQLLPGRYAKDATAEIFPLPLKSHVTISGSKREDTVIAGDGSRRIFEGRKLQNVTLRHLTLQNGKSGQRGGAVLLDSVEVSLIDSCMFQDNAAVQGGGLALRNNAGAVIQYTRFDRNQAQLRGGAINVEGDSVIIQHCEFFGNHAAGSGGALHGNRPKLAQVLSNRMRGNQAEQGGAVALSGGMTHIYRNTIIDNAATQTGGAIYVNAEANAIIGGTLVNGNDLYGNTAAVTATSLAGPLRNNPIDARYNFFGARPDDAVVSESGSFDTANFRRTSIVLPFDQRMLYLSPAGSDSNAAPSAQNPLRTLRQALRLFVSLPGDWFTLSLATGVYSKETSGEIFPLQLPSRIELAGSHADSVLLEGSEVGRILEIVAAESIAVRNVTLTMGNNSRLAKAAAGENGSALRIQNAQNIRVTGVHFHNNVTTGFGAGLSGVGVSGLLITQSRFTQNQGTGAGIYLLNSSADILASTFTGNSATVPGSAMYLDNTPALISGNRITQNHVASASFGGAIYSTGAALPQIGGEPGRSNDIFGNTGGAIGRQLSRAPGATKINARFNYFGTTSPTETDISPLEGYDIAPTRNLPLEGNNPPVWIAVTPAANQTLVAAKRDTVRFAVAAIDADNDALSYTWFADNFPVSFAQAYAFVAFFYATGEHNIRVEVSDGVNTIAAEWKINLTLTSVAEPQANVPAQFKLEQSFPHPMRWGVGVSRFTFHVARQSMIELVLYDVMGRRVRRLLHAERPAGIHEISWNGRDDSGRMLPAGVYLMRMTAGSYTATQKLIVVR